MGKLMSRRVDCHLSPNLYRHHQTTDLRRFPALAPPYGLRVAHASNLQCSSKVTNNQQTHVRLPRVGAPLKESEFQAAISRISGNATFATKAACYRQLLFVTGVDPPMPCFAYSIGAALRLAEIGFGPHGEESKRMEARVVCEIRAEPNMLNVYNTVHGGCIAHLIDICTSIPPIVMEYELHGTTSVSVSQNINTFYHAPALHDSILRLVAVSVSSGARVVSSRCEIWDKAYHRLVATGTQTLMRPSMPK